MGELIECSTVRMWIDDGVLYYVYKDAVVETEAEAREGLALSLRLIGEGHRIPVLADLTRIERMTRGARRFHGGPEPSAVATALALVVASPVARIIGNFFLGLNRPSYPVKLFSDRPAALAWLNEHRPATGPWAQPG